MVPSFRRIALAIVLAAGAVIPLLVARPVFAIPITCDLPPPAPQHNCVGGGNACLVGCPPGGTTCNITQDISVQAPVRCNGGPNVGASCSVDTECPQRFRRALGGPVL